MLQVDLTFVYDVWEDVDDHEADAATRQMWWTVDVVRKRENKRRNQR